MGRASPFVIELNGAERDELEALARRHRMQQRYVSRARIVLMADGQENTAIAEALGVTPNTAYRWRKRYWATSPFDPDATALFFRLISSRYARASLIVSSNKTSSVPGRRSLGDAVAGAAMVDRLVHHVEVIVLQGDRYRLNHRTKEVCSATEGG